LVALIRGAPTVGAKRPLGELDLATRQAALALGKTADAENPPAFAYAEQSPLRAGGARVELQLEQARDRIPHPLGAPGGWAPSLQGSDEDLRRNGELGPFGLAQTAQELLGLLGDRKK
jgi:hypothetical protein